MLDQPHITDVPSQFTAVIHLTIPRSQIQFVMGPAIGEVMGAIAGQGIRPSGPVFSYHLRMSPEVFDFEVGVPVATPVAPSGRVKPSQLPAAHVARAVYRGPYEGLGGAWGEFCSWIESQGLAAAPNLWEFYAVGPESTPDPSGWETVLFRPLLAT